MFEMRFDIDRMIGRVDDMASRQIPFAASQALNDTGKDVIEAEKAHMRRVFDRPTRWTLNAFRLQRSTKTRLRARILPKSQQGRRHYLEVQARGGSRPRAGFERAILSNVSGIRSGVTPAAIRRNASGNISRGNIGKLVAASKSKGAATKGRTRMFVPGRRSKLSPGVYSQTGRRGKLKKLVHFTRARPSYRARFRFEEVAMDRANRSFAIHFFHRFAQAQRTAR